MLKTLKNILPQKIRCYSYTKKSASSDMKLVFFHVQLKIPVTRK